MLQRLRCCQCTSLQTLDAKATVLMFLLMTECLLFFESMFLPIGGMIATQIGVFLLFSSTAASINHHHFFIFPALLMSVGVVLILCTPVVIVGFNVFRVLVDFDARANRPTSNLFDYPATLYEYKKSYLVMGVVASGVVTLCLVGLAVALLLLRCDFIHIENRRRMSRRWFFQNIRTPHDQQQYIRDKNHGRNPARRIFDLKTFYVDSAPITKQAPVHRVSHEV